MSVIRRGSDGTYPKASVEFKNDFFWDIKFEVLNHNTPSGRDLLAGGGRRICLTTRTTKSWDLGTPVWGWLPEECPRACDSQCSEASQYRQLQVSRVSQVRRLPLLTLKLYRNILLLLNSNFAYSERGIWHIYHLVKAYFKVAWPHSITQWINCC